MANREKRRETPLQVLQQRRSFLKCIPVEMPGKDGAKHAPFQGAVLHFAIAALFAGGRDAPASNRHRRRSWRRSQRQFVRFPVPFLYRRRFPDWKSSQNEMMEVEDGRFLLPSSGHRLQSHWRVAMKACAARLSPPLRCLILRRQPTLRGQLVNGSGQDGL